MLKQITLIIFCIVIVSALLSFCYVSFAPDIPSNSNDLIFEAKKLPLPEYYKGIASYAHNGDIKIWYEINKSTVKQKGTVLLIMGYGSSSIQWPQYFFQPFLESGYNVIRFDHRDIGKSTWLTSWNKNDPYTLEHIAGDVKSILKAEAIESAHIIGISMGGMIAQTFAIHYPENTLSLTSMSSSGYFNDKTLPGIFPETIKDITRYSLKFLMEDSPETAMKFNLTASNLFKGNYDLDNINTVLKTRFEQEKRNGFNPEAGKHHETAIKVSGSRYEELKNLDVPTLVIHGRADPLVPFEHGEKTAQLIPGAKTLYIDDLGHDIPLQFAAQMSDHIIELLDSVPSIESKKELRKSISATFSN